MIITNFRRRRKWGVGWTTMIENDENGNLVLAMPGEEFTGTFGQCRQWLSANMYGLGTASCRMAWFYDSKPVRLVDPAGCFDMPDYSYHDEFGWPYDIEVKSV